MDKKEFAERVKPLQKEVRYLGNLLGRVLEEQEGKAFLELVESVRKDAIELRRRHRPALEAKIIKKLKSLHRDKLLKLIRAFTVYFQLVNLAEEKHRIRRKRFYESNEKVQLGSLEDIVQRLKRSKMPFRKIEKALESISIDLVLTAHPTEAQRRSVLEKVFLIEKLLFQREYRALTPRELETNEAKIYEAISLLWQTDELRRRKQTVMDEVDNGLFYLDEVIYEALPQTIEHFYRLFSKSYDKKVKPRPILRFGSWIGGDRDGNPFCHP